MTTYAKAKEDLITVPLTKGWNVHRFGHQGLLKTPWTENPEKSVRIWFKPQALWYGPAGSPISAAVSTWIELRQDPQAVYALIPQRD